MAPLLIWQSGCLFLIWQSNCPFLIWQSGWSGWCVTDRPESKRSLPIFAPDSSTHAMWLCLSLLTDLLVAFGVPYLLGYTIARQNQLVLLPSDISLVGRIGLSYFLRCLPYFRTLLLTHSSPRWPTFCLPHYFLTVSLLLPRVTCLLHSAACFTYVPGV